MRTELNFMAIVLLCALTSTGCRPDKDDPIAPTLPPNEEELITTLQLHFHSSGGAEHKHFEFRDLDGDGGMVPVITADTLSADSIYAVEIMVLNESESPVEDISVEIEDEGDEHQFFFQVTGANVITVYTDSDANGDPIGLNSMWTLGAASNGTVIVTLRHGPDKSATGVSGGDITNADGDTDIEVSFPMIID